MITYLSSLSGGQTDADSLDEVPFNVHRQLDILKDGLEVLTEGLSSECRFSVADDIPDTLYADTDKLFRALRYVLENMVKSGAGFTIDISVRRYWHNLPDMVGLTFKVEGVNRNISEQEMKTPAGLWWPVCRQLMHVLGGSVSYTSDEAGNVCFELSLGCKEASSAS